MSRPVDLPTVGAWLQSHRRAVDATVVVVVFAYNLPIQFGAVPAGLWIGSGVVVSVGLCLPYLWRQRYPLGTFMAVAVVAVLQACLGIGVLVADVMLLLVLYNVASIRSWRVSVPAAVGVAAWVLVVVVAVMRRDDLSIGDGGVLVVAVVWAWTWGRLVQLRRTHIAGLRERALQLEREQATTALLAAATERARIAREIHDIVSHSLSVVVVMSEAAAATNTSEPERAQAAMLTVRDTGRTALAEMRRMLGVLRADEPGSHAPAPGIEQLGELVQASVNAGLPVNFDVDGVAGQVPRSVDLAAYRLVQESLTNVRRHAGPDVSRVDVRIAYLRETVEIEVRDDGVGMSGSESGYGLAGMRERAATVGGEIRFGTRPEGGFEMKAVLPLGGSA